MLFTTEKDNGIMVVTIEEKSFDAGITDAFKKEMTDILEENLKIIFDLGKVDFMDSSGCGAILSCLKKLSARGGDMKLFSVNKPVLSLLTLVRMHKVLEILNTRDEALQSF